MYTVGVNSRDTYVIVNLGQMSFVSQIAGYNMFVKSQGDQTYPTTVYSISRVCDGKWHKPKCSRCTPEVRGLIWGGDLRSRSLPTGGMGKVLSQRRWLWMPYIGALCQKCNLTLAWSSPLDWYMWYINAYHRVCTDKHKDACTKKVTKKCEDKIFQKANSYTLQDINRNILTSHFLECSS